MEPTPATAAPAGHVDHQLVDTREGKGPTVSVSIKPLEDRIVVKAVEAEQTTASGLVIPDTAKEKPQEGEVLAIGPGRVDDNGNRVPPDVAPVLDHGGPVLSVDALGTHAYHEMASVLPLVLAACR